MRVCVRVCVCVCMRVCVCVVSQFNLSITKELPFCKISVFATYT